VCTIGVKAREKEVATEVVKDQEVVEQTKRLIHKHMLAAITGHKGAKTELSENSEIAVPAAARRRRLADVDAIALGFNGLAGLKAHVSYYELPAPTTPLLKRQNAPVPRIPLCTEDHPENCRGVRAVSADDLSVRVHGRAGMGVGEGVGEGVKGRGGEGVKGLLRVDAQDAVMRAALWKAAFRKAQLIGRPAAKALGFSGVEQFAAHLERDALGNGA